MTSAPAEQRTAPKTVAAKPVESGVADAKQASQPARGGAIAPAQPKPIEPTTAQQFAAKEQGADNVAAAPRKSDENARTDAPPRIAEQPAQTASTPVPAVRVHERGSPQTVAALSADIARKLEARHTRFEVALDPVGLGKVNVKIEIGPSGAIAAAMSFDNPQSAEALKSRAGELQAALHSAGFDVADNGLSFTAGGMDHGQAQQRDSRASHPAFALTPIADEESAALTALPFRSRSADGRLDIRI